MAIQKLSGAWFVGVAGGKAIFFVRKGLNISGTSTISDGNWHHVAVSINGGIARLYVDGVMEASGSVAAVPPSYNGNIQVGYNISTEAASGYRMNIARVRLTQGRGRYPSNFTPNENTVVQAALAA